MSLSKYYQNSPAFQPEDLIKRDDSPSSGWQSAQQPERLPFQAQMIAADIETEKMSGESGAPELSEGVALNAKDKAAEAKTVTEADEVALPAQPEIDLSNYIELALAEKQTEEAYQKGLQEGIAKVEKEFAATTQALLNTCQQLDTIRETIINNSSEELQSLTLAIAERILRISVREQDNTLLLTIEEALQRAVKSDEFTVYIHPDDYDAVARNSEEIIAGLTGLNKIVIKKDSSLERGGAKIESDNCTVDATIVSQLEVIREEIKKKL